MILDLVIGLTTVVAMLYIVSKLPSSSCTGNCNQGRDCDCVVKK
jgi:hypothetical protein